MKERKLNQKHMATKLGISQPAFGKKLANSQFTYADLLTVIQEIQPSDEEILKMMKV